MQKKIETKETSCLVSCEDAALGYDGRAVLEHMTLQIAAGEYVCVVGENGSGKSTFVKTLLGLLRPVRGKVCIARSAGRGAVGYLPQQTQIQRNFPVSVMEVVLSGFLGEMRIRPFYTRAEKGRARSQLERLGIASLQKCCYGELSGGQQQRVLLARALCAADRLLVLDEPVTGLDPMAANALYENTKRLHQEGMTIIMVTHDIVRAAKYADKFLHISDGGYFFGSVEEYRQSKYAEKFLIS